MPDEKPRDARSVENPSEKTPVLIPVIGIAASAGGLKAFQSLLANLKKDTGMAFVLIQHLDPTHKSILTELLARKSQLPVVEISDGLEIEPDHVYVIPPNHQLNLLHNTLYFAAEGEQQQRYRPADIFFQSLAQDRGSRAIGIVLSGTASDGTLGCRAIKESGGITFAQDNESAEYDGMPSNAVAAGCIDFVLNPEDIARELVRIAHHPSLRPPYPTSKTEGTLMATREQMNRIFILLRSRTGHDFSFYKPTTIKRRISRRMMVNRIDDITLYIKLLQKNPIELDTLFQDILINVTSFYRDPEVFAELRQTVVPQLLENRPADLPVRIWVAGCSTGEEAYTLAITIDQYLREHGRSARVQIFGSDIDEAAVEKARRGLYLDTSLAEVPPVLRERYFHRVAGGYQVSKQLRDMCVFAVQNITKDPPFSRIDLVTCRNLLIYLNSTLQRKVLQVIHYALQPGGFLLLGSSETIGSQSDLYSAIDKKSKIYQKKAIAACMNGDLAFRPIEQLPPIERPAQDTAEAEIYDLDTIAERVLLDNYVPPGVIVGPDHSILRFIGRTWPYIEASPGAASLNLYKNAHPDLFIELRAAVHSVSKDGKSARKDNVRLLVDGREQRVNIHVIPLSGAVRSENNLLVMFEPQPAPSDEQLPSSCENERDQAVVNELVLRKEELEREVTSTREYMQSIVEEQEGTNEELRSANEEIQSTNEELQSTNEELETAKEELQSANEELATVNEELETRNQETDRANSDLVNLLASINIPIVILGTDLRIRQFTKPAQKLLNLIDTDVGRPISNIKANIEIPDLETEVLHVIDAMVTQSMELQDDAGHWYSVRLRPYRTLDKRIDGAVVTFIDIDDIKDVENTKAALAKERRLATIVRDSSDAITVQDFEGNIQAWNPAAERLYGYTEAEALCMNIRQLVAGDDHEKLINMLAELRNGKNLAPLEIQRLDRDGKPLNIRLIASVLMGEQQQPVAVATTERLV